VDNEVLRLTDIMREYEEDNSHLFLTEERALTDAASEWITNWKAVCTSFCAGSWLLRIYLLSIQKALRLVIHALSGGRLQFCSSGDELPETLPALAACVSLEQPAGVKAVRDVVSSLAASRGYPAHEVDDLVLAASEASMNANQHGRGPRQAKIFSSNDKDLQIWVSDAGPGMPLRTLLQCIFGRGYSTRNRYGGLGWSFLLSVCRKAYLHTIGGNGTVLVICASST
jgi:anti-sigma regulatory factor (Ser/Thr protein kinase)